MSKKISNKDKQDWESFIKNKEKVPNKDLYLKKNKRQELNRTIDLHGFTQFRAHSYINEELLKCYKNNIRSILIITGKKFGKMGAEGVLKREVPKWLNLSPLKEIILMTSWATPRDGGEGALYVLLRRVR